MVDLHGKYYDGHYSHARMIQSCYHLKLSLSEWPFRWLVFLWGFLGDLAFSGRREVARWTVFSNAECREVAR